ncbi:hypothetical protein CHS0354_019943 [Potamilus streckersoni]|uniref:Uncharacterized protein n=1 Tax=Potamilus streckersoni TaxID=2493646 RepID=A0AAE0S073_9BIVA|nr:hypothetical protein CHS0354_019943 [Potamilus streckersoni]
MARYLQLYVPDLSMTLIDEFRTRFRTLEICIENKTSEALSFTGSYFATGGMFQIDESPRDVVPRSGSVYFLASTLYFTGVSGGWKFKVVGTDLYLYIGFCNPLLGRYKTFVNLNKDGTLPAEWPYNESMDSSMKTSECDGYIAEVTLTYPHYSNFQRMHYKIYYK